MKLSTLVLAIALIAGSIALADNADASPLSSITNAASNAATPYWVQVQDPGRYQNVAQRVWVPPHFAGYDMFGNPLMHPGHFRIVYKTVFVPGRVRMVWVY